MLSIDFVLYSQHHHLDDFDEDSPSAHSVSLRGRGAATTEGEDAPYEDEELIQYGYYNPVGWKKYTTGNDPYTGRRWGEGFVPHEPYIPSIPQVGRIDTPSGYDNAGSGGFDYCSQVYGGRQACYAAGCMRRKGLCVKKRSNRGNRGGNVHTSQTNGCNTVMNGKCVDGICLKDCPNSCAFSVGNCCHACA